MVYRNHDYINCDICNAKHDRFKECHVCAKAERLSGIQCPCCKGSQIEEGGVYSSNGIIGPGHSSTNKFPHLFCLECGVIFKNLKGKK